MRPVKQNQFVITGKETPATEVLVGSYRNQTSLFRMVRS